MGSFQNFSPSENAPDDFFSLNSFLVKPVFLHLIKESIFSRKAYFFNFFMENLEL